MESNPRGCLPSQPMANPKHNPQAFASHTQVSSSQGPHVDEFKEITRLRNEKSFPKVDMNQPKRVLPRLGDKEEKGDSNEQKEKEKVNRKLRWRKILLVMRMIQ